MSRSEEVFSESHIHDPAYSRALTLFTKRWTAGEARYSLLDIVVLYKLAEELRISPGPMTKCDEGEWASDEYYAYQLC